MPANKRRRDRGQGSAPLMKDHPTNHRVPYGCLQSPGWDHHHHLFVCPVITITVCLSVLSSRSLSACLSCHHHHCLLICPVITITVCLSVLSSRSPSAYLSCHHDHRLLACPIIPSAYLSCHHNQGPFITPASITNLLTFHNS